MKKRSTIHAVLLGIAMLAACGKNEKSYQVEAMKVSTETVSSGTSSARKHYVGKVEEESSTPVSFTGMGTVNRVCVEEGQYVSRGQVIAEMDPTQCENTLQAAKATLDQALDVQSRMQKLHETQAVSDVDWVNVQTKVRQAQASLDIATKALKDCKLLAPCSGVVGKKQMESGMTALPSQPVCTILDISRVKIRVSIPEKEIAYFSPQHGKGKGVTVSAEALGGKTFFSDKFVRSVEGDVLTHTYDVRFSLHNPGLELLPGMVVSVTTEAEEEAAALTVPLRCVQQNADESLFVWLVKNGKSHRQPVEVGQTQGDRIGILSGLAEGDKVITEGFQKVSEGSEIREIKN